MIRISAFVWILVLGLLGVGLFQVKYNVQSKEAELRGINRQIDSNRSAIHVLDAEWSYLNDPTRLADLTRRHTDLTPSQASQIKHFADLPPRPASAQPDLPALSNAAPNVGMPGNTAVAAAPSTVAPATNPARQMPAGVIPVSATAGNVPSAAPAVASTIAATPTATTTTKPVTAKLAPAQAAAAATGQATAAKSATAAKPGADEVIDAILADMQRQQGGNATPQAGDQ